MTSDEHMVGPALSHLVINVRDLERSHEFYTEVLGLERCGQLTNGSSVGKMWFYRGNPEIHHHIALVQAREPAADPEPWRMNRPTVGINHIAFTYPTREAFLARLRHLVDTGVEIIQRGDHGMTHSAYIQDPDGNGVEVMYDLPSDVWSSDVNAALNYFDQLPTEGPETLVDSTDYVRF